MHEQEPIERTQERHIATGRRIVGRIRDDSNAADGYFFSSDNDEDPARSLYLTPRDTAIPGHLLSDDSLDDIHRDIRALYGQVFDGIGDELIENYANPIWIVVDPDVEDHTTSVLCTDRSLLLMRSSKAWQFIRTTEGAAAEEWGRWYEGTATGLQLDRQRKRDEKI